MSVLRLHDIEPRIAKEHIDRGEAIIVDVREAAEYRTERIPQSQLVPLSSFDSTHVANTGDKKISSIAPRALGPEKRPPSSTDPAISIPITSAAD